MTTSGNEAGPALIEAHVTLARQAAAGINLYRVEARDNRPLPQAIAGAHIDFHLPNGLIRQYSLVLDGQPGPGYTVAVKRDVASRGGSSYIHEEFRVGTALNISNPRNHFPLDETADHSIFIAGGIGITPIYSMINRLRHLGKTWELYYACRARAEMAFLNELAEMPQANLHFDEECEGAYLNVEQIVRGGGEIAHFYCCGPMPLMQSFEAVAAGVPAANKHVEYFSPKAAAPRTGSFVVQLAKSGLRLSVPEGRTILEVVLEAGVAVEHSCTEGICGTCETRVISGVPQHRDSLLSEAERAANKTMFICCSGSTTEELVLDL